MASEGDAWRQNESPGVLDHVPMWIVGVTADDLLIADVLSEYHMTNDGPDAFGSAPVEGAWYAWDANSGAILGQGVLGPSWSQTMASLAQLPDRWGTLSIVPATVWARSLDD